MEKELGGLKIKHPDNQNKGTKTVTGHGVQLRDPYRGGGQASGVGRQGQK